MQESTERYPGLMLVASSIYQREQDVVLDLSVHAPTRTVLGHLEADLRADPRLKRLTRVGARDNPARFHVQYQSEHSIFGEILEHTPITMGPTRISEGVEHYHLLGTSVDIQRLVQALSKHGALEVVAIREPEDNDELIAGLSLGSSDAEPARAHLWDGLTSKQLQAVVVAAASGYYRWPREVTAAQLAASRGLSNSAFLDQLRRGESGLMEAIVARLEERDPARHKALLRGSTPEATA